jgi:hypothetical protein
MHKTVLVLAALMIVFGSIVASEAEEKQNPGGTGGGGVPGQPTTTAPKKPTTTVPKQPTTTAPTQPPVLGLKSVVCTPPPPPPPVQCPSNASSCLTSSFTSCCTAPAGNKICAPTVIVGTSQPKQCAHGYYGTTCAQCPGAASAVCNNQGICSDTITGNGTCTCNPGYTGAACETKTPN